ncbi:Uncharacterised protein [Segatella copri]|nr:Uncharacterised protein [Segatella copri]
MNLNKPFSLLNSIIPLFSMSLKKRCPFSILGISYIDDISTPSFVLTSMSVCFHFGIGTFIIAIWSDTSLYESFLSNSYM